jgi:hypothetical protein
MRTTTILLLLLTVSASAATFNSGNPTTTNNDDSCDIAALPAATLLLPYFEVDFNSPQTTARTTLFTVVNTTQRPQIAHVTVWTDLGYPALSFNLFLTGYDVQAINLYDVLGPRAIIGSPSGTSNGTVPGDRSLDNSQNPNFAATAASHCSILPGAIPTFIMADLRNAFTTGLVSSCGTARVGNPHANAAGFVTIDVDSDCTSSLPTDPRFPNEILYDNVLTGDFQWINPNPATGNYAGGNPLVHIRAIPEGGAAGVTAPTNLPYTFYERFMPVTVPKNDRRQPLPSTFTARFIQGGTGAFNTDFRIWREGVTGGGSTCPDYASNNSSAMSVREIVRFDEHENPNALPVCVLPCSPTTTILPMASSSSTSAAVFPPMSTVAGDVAGWMYLNLATEAASSHNQNWVVISMSAEGRYSVAYDALMLANGCTPAPTVSNSQSPIGPGPNINP